LIKASDKEAIRGFAVIAKQNDVFISLLSGTLIE